MKVKHLLFSSLFLSAGFAACTSDVEEFNAQAPVTNPEGIELGEGFSFQVENAGFGADAETRAHFDKEGTSWNASWDNTDKVGAALYSMVTGLNTTGDNIGKPKSFYNSLALNNLYFSNNEFAYQKEEGKLATFTSATNSMVGAYMLYYPYDITLNQQKAFTEIPVYSGAKADNATSSLTFDATNVEEGVNNRIFAATIAKFEENSNNAPTFELQQVPNLYMVKFALADHLLMTLKQPVKIEHIIMEAKAGSNSAININGIVKPTLTSVEEKHFNGYVKTSDPLTYWDLGGITFDGSNSAYTASNLTITPVNVPEESDLHINVLGKDARTAPYYFSALPLDGGVLGGSDDITELRFTIVAKVNGVDKVFTKVFNATEDVMKKASNVKKNADTYYTNWELVQMRTQGMGQVINLGVVLDTEDESNQIYTIGQFADKWANNQKTFDFAVAGLDFSTLDVNEFTSEAGDIVFNNCEQKFYQDFRTTKEGTITFNIPVTIEGNVTAFKKNITFNKVVNKITGDVVADNATITFEENVTIDGNVKTLNGGKVIFKKQATINKNTAITDETADNGLLSVDATGEVNFMGKAIIGGIESAGTITFGGEASTGNIDATAGDITFGAKATTGNIDAEDAVISFTGDAKAKVEGTIDAANEAKITFKTVEVTGAITANQSTIAFGKDSQAKAGITATGSTVTLAGTVTGNVEAESTTLSGAATITGNVELANTLAQLSTVTVNGEISVDAESMISKGTITAGKVTVLGDLATGVKVAAINEELVIKPTGVVNITGSKATSKIAKVTVEKGVSKAGKLTANSIVLANITNNGTIDGTFAVDGNFDQNASADAAVITVNEGATLNVNTNMNTAGIINNGKIVVAAKMTLSGVITNNSDITVNGTLTETATDALVMAETASISVNKGATLTYDALSANKTGVVYIENGIVAVPSQHKDKAGTQKTIAYKWSKTAPSVDIKAKYNRLCMDGATITDQNVSDQLLNKKEIYLYAAGMKVNTTSPLALGGSLMVMESATISTNSKVQTTFDLFGTANYVAAGQTLTLVENLILNKGTLNLLKDAEFKGNVAPTATVKHVGSM